VTLPLVSHLERLAARARLAHQELVFPPLTRGDSPQVVSSREELRLPALAQPGGNLSVHPAPIVQPSTKCQAAHARTASARVSRWPAVRVGVKQRLQIQAHDRLGDALSHGGYPEDS